MKIITLLEMYIRNVFIDFVQGLLNMDPIKRWSPQQAKLHPFITGERFTGHWEVGSDGLLSKGPAMLTEKPLNSQHRNLAPARPVRQGNLPAPTSDRRKLTQKRSRPRLQDRMSIQTSTISEYTALHLPNFQLKI